MSCTSSVKNSEVSWNQSFYTIGTQSSPRAIDLNSDGVLDIIVGAGKDELAHTDHGVIAIDGITGNILWEVATEGHIYGSPVFCNITNDLIPDIIIGGRNKNLLAINGSTGDLIWNYEYNYVDDPILQFAQFNFYNGTIIPDQNGNGHDEYITINGGNWDALPNSDTDRYPGVLMVFDTKNGEILAADVMPDGKESYMSPLVLSQSQRNEILIVFGTGGETTGGHLFMADLSALFEKNLSSSKILRSQKDHGFISPPAAVDVTGDGILDVLSTTHDSHLSAINGADYSLLWEYKFQHMESSNGLTIGQFTEDNTPDVFTIMNQGVWPDYKRSKQIMINGKTGELMFEDSIGCFNLTTAVAYDLNYDGIEEVVMSYNDYNCEEEFEEGFDSPKTMSNSIIVVDFITSEINQIDQSPGFRNIFSSPWLGDIDADGYVDVVYCQNYNPRHIFKYAGMRIKRVSTSRKISKDVLWGEYMGKHGKGIFQ